MASEQLWPLQVEARGGFKLWVRFGDGVEGEVDLSQHAGRGVFKVWDTPGVFEAVSVSPHRSIRWTEDIELCADAIYLEITGLDVEEIMPGLSALADA